MVFPTIIQLNQYVIGGVVVDPLKGLPRMTTRLKTMCNYDAPLRNHALI